MRMHVTIHDHAALLRQSFDHGFCIPNGWICFTYYSAILSIQVFARQRAARIAHDNAVRIQHRYHFEYEFVSQFFCNHRVAGNEVHQTFHHPR